MNLKKDIHCHVFLEINDLNMINKVIKVELINVNVSGLGLQSMRF